MQVHIWQQFSSNHSSFFHVVGAFYSTDAANLALATLHDLAQFADTELQQTYTDPTANKRLEDRYHIQLHHQGIDYRDVVLAVEGLTILDKIIELDNSGFDTWNNGDPFYSLFEKLSGLVGGMWEDNHGKVVWLGWRFRLQCQAPGEQVAQHIQQQLAAYWRNPDDVEPPWWEYHLLFAASRFFKQEQLEVLSDRFEREMALTIKVRRGKPRATFHIRQSQLSKMKVTGRLKVAGSELFFHDIFCGVFGLALLITYLEQQGCTHIKYWMYIAELGMPRLPWLKKT